MQDDFYSILNSLSNNASTTTTTEQENQTGYNQSYNQTGYNQQTYSSSTPSYNSWLDDDDYSTRQNFEEQQSYNSSTSSYNTDMSSNSENEVFEVRQMEAPMIKKEQPAVNLIKKRQRIELGARMKMVVAVFSVIVAALLTAIIWNFAAASSMKASFASKQAEITALNESINGLKQEYNLLSDDAQIKIKAQNEGYVDANDNNTIVVDFKSYYADEVVEELPSNWFNDVCDFLAGLFN